MADRCYICGTELQETNYGRKFCPNHGIIDEEETSESEKRPSYLG